MFEWIENEPDLGRVDVCIPNAGFSAPDTLTQGGSKSRESIFKKMTLYFCLGSPDKWRDMLDINVVSLCLCTQLAIKSMTKVSVAKIPMVSVVLINCNVFIIHFSISAQD